MSRRHIEERNYKESDGKRHNSPKKDERKAGSKLQMAGKNELNPELYDVKKEKSYHTSSGRRDKISGLHFRNNGKGFIRHRNDVGHRHRPLRNFKTNHYKNDINKPVVRLFDPATVPKTGKYFEHDSRDRNEFRPYTRNQQYNMYDPRSDFQRKRAAPTGWRNQIFEVKREFGRGNVDEAYSSNSTQDHRSADRDKVWVHDKFELIENEEKKYRTQE